MQIAIQMSGSESPLTWCGACHKAQAWAPELAPLMTVTVTLVQSVLGNQEQDTRPWVSQAFQACEGFGIAEPLLPGPSVPHLAPALADPEPLSVLGLLSWGLLFRKHFPLCQFHPCALRASTLPSPDLSCRTVDSTRPPLLLPPHGISQS